MNDLVNLIAERESLPLTSGNVHVTASRYSELDARIEVLCREEREQIDLELTARLSELSTKHGGAL